jgi:murein DD-endopeptidase MepM/ murein hydrolase activator NlpD
MKYKLIPSALLFLAAASGGVVGPAHSEERPVAVAVLTQRGGGGTQFVLQNQKDYPVTVTVRFNKLENLTADVPLPFTRTLPPLSTVPAFALRATGNEPSSWEYSYRWNTGPANPLIDMRYDYSLPYAAGEAYTILQGYDGHFSHSGWEKYCVDWTMPEGTAVYAARDGRVLNTEDRYSKSGGRELRDQANYVRILHPDGTVGVYLHFRKKSVFVEEGDYVRAGDLIGFSGNTGFSSEPHLHFGVFRVVDGEHQESIPVTFRTTRQTGLTLLAGRSYQN